MTISSQTASVSYTGNGAVDTYAYTFKIFDDDDLLVTVRNISTYVETTLTKTTDYTVTGVGETSGGNVVLVNSSQAWLDGDGDLSSSYALTIRVRPTVTQETDIRNQGEYFPEDIEDQFDKTVNLIKSLQHQTTRSLKAPETESGIDMTIPYATERASSFLAFDATGAPIAAVGATEGVTVTAFMETVLDDATAADARTTLGFSGTGGTVAAANIDTDAVTTAKIQAGAVTLPKLADNTFSALGGIQNYSLSASVGSSALTIALKTAAGADASSSDPIKIVFRDTTATTGTNSIISVTGALSLVISSGSTLGHVSATPDTIYVYAINNSGTVVLGVSTTNLHDTGTLTSSTAEGGAGAADDRHTLYTTSAVTSKPIRLIGRLLSTQTTAGTWAAVPTEISSTIVPTLALNDEVRVNTPNGHGSGSTKIRIYTVVERSAGDAITRATSATLGDTFTINKKGLYFFSTEDSRSGGTGKFGISINSNQLTTDIDSITSTHRVAFGQPATGTYLAVTGMRRCVPGDVVRHHGAGNSDDASTLGFFHIIRVSD